MQIQRLRDRGEIGIWYGYVTITATSTGILGRVSQSRHTFRQLLIGWWWGTIRIKFDKTVQRIK